MENLNKKIAQPEKVEIEKDPAVVEALSNYIRESHPDVNEKQLEGAVGRVLRAAEIQKAPMDVASIAHMHSSDKKMIDDAVSIEMQKDTNPRIGTLEGWREE